MIKVLLLEDETMIQMLIEDYITDLGYEVIPTSNLEEGLDTANSAEFDFALLDINLGDGTNSYPLATVLKERGIPFAFMTGYHAQGVEGFEDITKLSKPVNFGVLTDTLRSFAERKIAPQSE